MRAQWLRFVDGIETDGSETDGVGLDGHEASGTAVRRLVLDSWRRSRAAGVDPRPAHLVPRRVSDDELLARCSANAALIDVARSHLDWLSAAHARIPHMACIADRDGIVLYAAGNDAGGRRWPGARAGTDWSEPAIGTNGVGTALVLGEPVVVAGAEHFVEPLHAYTCTAAPVRGPDGEVIGVLDITAPTDAGAAERLLLVSYAAYALGQDLLDRVAADGAAGDRGAGGSTPRERAAERRLTTALREREVLLRDVHRQTLVSATIGDAVIVLDPAGRIIDWNPGAERMYGYTKDEMLGRSPTVFHHPSLEGTLEATIRATLDRERQWSGELPFMRKDGREGVAEVVVVNQYDAAGTPIARIGVNRDITERKRAEVALREREHLLREGERLAQFGSWAWDAGTDTAIWSDELLRIFGLERTTRTVSQDVFLALLHPDDREMVRARIAHALASRTSYDVRCRIVRRDGAVRVVRIRASVETDATGAPTRITGVTQDVTDVEAVEHALRESEARYRLATRATNDVVYDWNVRAGTVYWSEALATVLGHASQDVATDLEWWMTQVHPEDRGRVRAALQALLASPDDGGSVEYRLRRGDGTYAHVLERAYVVRDPDGAPARVVGAIADQSRHRDLEDRLRQAQKLEAVGRLAGGIAHDFNNLLTVIRNYGSFVDGALPAQSPAHADVGEILKAVDRAAALTRQLLAFGRQQVLRPQLLDVNREVASIAGLLRRVIGEDVHLETRWAADAWPVRVDPGQLEQVLLNLVMNARDAMPDGGTLRLATANAVVDPATDGAWAGLPAGDYVVLTVEDTGSGIEADVLPHIFEPFFTTKAIGKGTGLGLPTVHGIVEQSGGAVRVDSTPGIGSRFSVLLPRADATLGPPTPEAREATPPTRGSETILVVEDDAIVRAAVRRMLTRLGYTVVEAADGVAALAAAEAHDGRLGLVLTDVVMPVMSGRVLGERLAARWPGLRVVYMSGYTDDAALRRGPAASGDGFLVKPFTTEELARLVRDALDRRGPGTSAPAT